MPEPLKIPNQGRRCLVLAMRHMGDTVITAGFINRLLRHDPRLTVDVLGRAALKEVLAEFSSFNEYIEIEFPVYRHHARNLASITNALRRVISLRNKKYDYCLNLIGDVRENLIGRLTGARRNVGPLWERGHPFAHKISARGPAWLLNGGISIPAQYSNYYESLGYLAKKLGLSGETAQEGEIEPEPRAPSTIALHPGASHPSRRWPREKWKHLIGKLKARGFRLVLIGAPFERQKLMDQYREEIFVGAVELKTGSLNEMNATLRHTDLLIGMDSFSVHAAHALGIKSVVLYCSSPLESMTPPGSIPLGSGELCPNYPCYYKYPCAPGENPYICLRGIEIDRVVNAAETILQSRRGWMPVQIQTSAATQDATRLQNAPNTLAEAGELER